MNHDLEEKLALLIINKGGRFANGYGLIKVLGMFFNFSMNEMSEIIDRILYKKLVLREDIRQIGHYQITEQGRQFMNADHQLTIETLKQHFPERDEILDAFYLAQCSPNWRGSSAG